MSMVFEIDVLTPIQPSLAVPINVLYPLINQEPHIIRHYITEGPIVMTDDRIDNIIMNRNIAKNKGYAPFAMFLDSDVVIPPNSLGDLAYRLWEDESIGVISLDFENRSRNENHIDCAAMMWRKSLLEKYTFRRNGIKCECLAMTDDIRNMGLKAIYHPTLYAEHLRDRFKGKQYLSKRAMEESKTLNRM